mgnify:CR=1 FL=1
MSSLTKQEERIIKLAEKGGKNAGLFLLDQIHELEDTLKMFQNVVEEKITDLKDRITHSSQEVISILKQTEMMMDKFSSVERLKGDVGKSPTDEELIVIIKPLIPEPIKGDNYILTQQDKKDIAKSIPVPIFEKIVETIIEKQPIITNEIKEIAIIETAEKIRDKIESLKDNERVDKSAIKGLTEELEKLKSFIQSGQGRSFGGVLSVGVRVETPVGIVNGINTIFVAYKYPKYVVGDGITYFEGNGYTYSGKTLTMTIPPSQYLRSFY